MSYLETTKDVYKEAALTPDIGLCCTTNPIWELPGLKIPRIMVYATKMFNPSLTKSSKRSLS